jgi:hypothetical protein
VRKTRFSEQFSIAMSQEDGCLVIVRNQETVVGSLTRAQTLMLAQGCIDFVPPIVREKAPPKLSLVPHDEAP